MEVILVTVIVGIGAGLAIPNVRMGIENRQAKQSLETLRSIHHAIRMYDVDHSALPVNLLALQNAGYLNSAEYAFLRKVGAADLNGYEYSISPTTNIWAQAQRFSTVTVPGKCREVCTGEEGCEKCHQECDPPTTQKNPIRTVQVCKNQSKIRDVLGSSGSQAGLLSTIGTSPCPAS